MDNNDYKSKMFEEAIKLVLWDYHQKEIDEFNTITEDEKHKFSLAFESRMQKILKRAKRFKGELKISALKTFQKIGIIVLIILSISFVSLFTVEAIRKEIFNIITTFYEKYIGVSFESESSQNYIIERIEETYLPSYVPDGYSEVEILKSDNNIIAIYINDKDEMIIYSQDLVRANMNIDGEDYTESDIIINGMSGKLFEYAKPDGVLYNILIWTDNKYSYSLQTYLIKTEVIKIAESVKLQVIE